MAKLYFKYGAMNCGKTTTLLQTAHNYEEQGMRVFTLKPSIDTKGNETIISRLGVARKVDKVVTPEDNLLEFFSDEMLKDLACILVDEVQFLTICQVNELYKIAVLKNTPVICFGLRTDFQMNGFPASSRLMEIAHSMTEMKNVCRCGNKATCNLRLVNGKPTLDGSQVAIDGVDEVEYIAVCSKCWLEMTGNLDGCKKSVRGEIYEKSF